MIIIKEDTPNKFSGLTSLFLSFPFNQDIINIIKTSEKYAYDKKTYTWELPINCLAYLLDNLTYLDDITLQLIKEDNNREHLYPKLEHEIPPFKHQLEGIEFGLNQFTWLLLDEPGAGKTTQMIYLAEELKEQKGLEHCLIICGINTLKTNWKKEIKKFSKLSCRILGEKVNSKGKVSYASIKERASELMQPIKEFFIITNIETLRDDNIVQALRTTKNNIEMVVVDEVHKCTNPNSQQSHNLLKLKKYEYKIGLTGTLIMNNPLSAYTALKWIGVEKSTFTNFKSLYCVFGGFGGHQIVGYKNLELLKNEIQTCSLRRTKAEFVDLPPKTVINEFIEMDDKHRKFYDNVKDGVKEECDKIELKSNSVLALTTRLRQATSCPTILTSENIMSSKIERALELVEEITENNNKVVIMSTFKEPVYVLKTLLKKYNPLIGTGDISDEQVSKNIDLFQTDPKYKVFIGTYSKMSTGITLNAASYMICLDQAFTYAQNQQAQDRIHRINNTKPVFIYNLICLDTIDEHVNEIVSVKKDFSDFMVDDENNKALIDRLKLYIQGL